MPNDPRFKFKCRETVLNNTNARKDFFGAIGKIGDLEILNRFGNLGSTFNTLSKVSDSIRDDVFGDDIDAALTSAIANADSTSLGGTIVGGAFGVTENTVNFVNNINPGVANIFISQTEDLFDRIRDGDFSIDQIPNYVQDIQNMVVLGGRIYTKDPDDTDVAPELDCYSTPYARALAGRFSPKTKYLFVVEFVPNTGYEKIAEDVSFLIRTSTRPTVRYEYEDINVYNFRTKVVKRSEYEPMTMAFYDDMSNTVGKFYEDYIKATVPVANVQKLQEHTFEEHGMNMSTNDDTGHDVGSHSASIGALLNNKLTVFSAINLYHIQNFGLTVNKYQFMNPKIMEMQLDDLDMASSEPTQMQMQFAYDSFFLQEYDMVSEGGRIKANSGAEYPIDVQSRSINQLQLNARRTAEAAVANDGVSLSTIDVASNQTEAALQETGTIYTQAQLDAALG